MCDFWLVGECGCGVYVGFVCGVVFWYVVGGGVVVGVGVDIFYFGVVG